MSDGTNDRGVKPPRTLFSLGRPSAEKSAAPVEAPDTGSDDTELDYSAETDSGFLCGACDAPLPIGAVFCAECGTQVAVADGELDEGEYDEVNDLDDVTVAEVEPVAEVPPPPPPPPEPVVEPEPVAEVTPVVEPEPVAPPAVHDLGSDTDDVDDAYEPAVYDTGPVQPAAVLFQDQSQVEPLAVPQGSWNISEATVGTSDGAYLYGDANVVDDQDLDLGQQGTTDTFDAEPAVAASTTRLPYGSGPVETSEKKGKTGLIIGAAAAVVVVLIIGGLAVMSGGGKDDKESANVATQAGPSSTTTTSGAVVTTTSPSVTPTGVSPSATSTPPSTKQVTDSSTAPTSTVSVPPTTTGPTVAPTQPTEPPTTIKPGQIEATPGNGQTVTIPKGGSTQIVLHNSGSVSASCTMSIGRGNLSLSQNCSPNVPAGGNVVITVKANGGFEGAGTVTGLMEGIGSYTLNVFVSNG